MKKKVRNQKVSRFWLSYLDLDKLSQDLKCNNQIINVNSLSILITVDILSSVVVLLREKNRRPEKQINRYPIDPESESHKILKSEKIHLN